MSSSVRVFRGRRAHDLGVDGTVPCELRHSNSVVMSVALLRGPLGISVVMSVALLRGPLANSVVMSVPWATVLS